MSPADQLFAIEAIKQTKARYWRTMDRRLWDEYEKVFADDCVFDIRVSHVEPPIGKMPTADDPDAIPEHHIVGAKAIRHFVETMLTGVRSVHQGHIPEIEILSPTEATAIFPFEDVLDFPAGVSPRHVHGFGHYHETYRCVQGRWLISALAIYRLRVTATDGDLL